MRCKLGCSKLIQVCECESKAEYALKHGKEKYRNIRLKECARAAKERADLAAWLKGGDDCDY